MIITAITKATTNTRTDGTTIMAPRANIESAIFDDDDNDDEEYMSMNGHETAGRETMARNGMRKQKRNCGRQRHDCHQQHRHRHHHHRLEEHKPAQDARKVKRSVRFNDAIQIREHISRSEITHEETQRAFFRRRDLQVIIRRSHGCVQLYEKQKALRVSRSERTCVRGLEALLASYRTMREGRERVHTAKEARFTVLYEQKLGGNSEEIAMAYSRHTSCSAHKAIIRARKDVHESLRRSDLMVQW